MATYGDLREILPGDVFKTSDKPFYTYSVESREGQLFWVCQQISSTVGTIPNGHFAKWSLVKRKDIPKSGFGKFIKRIESKN